MKLQFRGYRVSIDELAQAIDEGTGKQVTIKSFPWWMLYPLLPFSSAVQGIFEMRYLWCNEMNLTQGELEQVLRKMCHISR